MLLEMAGEDDGKMLNDIQRELDMDVFDIRDTNEYHKKGKALKRDYERLHRLATNQPVESPFNEPKARFISIRILLNRKYSYQLNKFRSKSAFDCGGEKSEIKLKHTNEDN